MRIFMSVSVVVVAILATVHGRALGQEIKISHQWAEGTDGRDRAARVFVQEVQARTNGLTFRIYPNSSLKIKPNELFAALRNNTLEMAVYPLTYAVADVPEFSLAGLPGLVPDLDAAHALKARRFIRHCSPWQKRMASAFSPGGGLRADCSRRTSRFLARSPFAVSKCGLPIPYSRAC